MVYLISYDINTAIKDYDALYSAIKGISGDYQHPLESVWLVYTPNHSADEIFHRLHELISPKDHLLVVRFSNQYQGWLSKIVWEWLNKKEI